MTAISKFTPEVRGAILGALRTGVSFDIACSAAGVSRMTMWRWAHRGELDQAAGMDTEHARFLRQIRSAEASVLAGVEQSLLRTAASGVDWRAAAWVLARKMPLQYGEVVITEQMRVEMTSELFEVVERRAPSEFYQQLLRYILEDPTIAQGSE